MKSFLKRYNISIIILVVGALFVSFAAFIRKDELMTICSAASFGFVMIAEIVYSEAVRRKLSVRAKSFSNLLDVHNAYAFERLQLACCIIEDDGEITWFNPTFSNSFKIDKKTSTKTITELLDVRELSKLKKGEGFKVSFDGRSFSVNSCAIPLGDGESDYLLYFYDETELVGLRKKYRDTRPVLMLTLIDNADDIYEHFKESECAAIFSLIEQEIDNWASSYGAMCRKYSNARMLIIAEERSLGKMITGKFAILERIRNLSYDGQPVNVTLSIGVGKNGSLTDIRNYARQALDMSQSRGGDQVSIKDEKQYKFYGGVSEGKEQKNKVRTRFIARSVAEIIGGSPNVLIMGHRYSDFDAFGSAAGMFCLCRHLGVEANIVVDKKTTLASVIMDQYVSKFGLDTVVSPERAKGLVDENTLLIVVDTHKRDFTESPELVDKCKRIIVIDHHRKSVGYIENTLTFYHRPNSSSASEMVSEILQYADSESFLDPLTAQALLAGIMLDTRNFVIRCGVRTFEAAAFLKSCSADTVAAKKLFSSDMDLYRLRNAVIDAAQRYRNICAISVADFENKNIRQITSQAADEMLNIENVKASFVLYRNGDDTNISARSYGEMNVQLVMETLGGGGHQAMSACQLNNTGFDEAIDLLHDAIDKYISENQEV